MATILLIDDEELVRDTLEEILRSAGHEVTTAENGEVGLERYRQATFDLVITDIIMPEKEGLQTIIDIIETNPRQRVIAISGGGRDKHYDYLESARVFGAMDVLTKPISVDDLLTRVAACLDEERGLEC